MDRELIIGAGSDAHVRCESLVGSVLLMVRDERLLCQARGSIEIAGKPASSPALVPLGAHVQTGALSFVVTVS